MTHNPMATTVKRAVLMLVSETVGLPQLSSEDFAFLDTVDAFAGSVVARTARAQREPDGFEVTEADFHAADIHEDPSSDNEDLFRRLPEATQFPTLDDKTPNWTGPMVAGTVPPPDAPERPVVETGTKGPAFEDVDGSSPGAETVSTLPNATGDDMLPPGAPDYSTLENKSGSELLHEVVQKTARG